MKILTNRSQSAANIASLLKPYITSVELCVCVCTCTHTNLWHTTQTSSVACRHLMACNCCAIRYYFLLLFFFLTVFERRSYFFHSDNAIVLAATRTPTRHLILRYRHLTHDYHPISNFGTANEQPVILDASTNRRSGGLRDNALSPTNYSNPVMTFFTPTTSLEHRSSPQLH